MATELSRTDVPFVDDGPDEGWFFRVLASPYLWGALVTVAFYGAIPHLPAHRELAERYFCGHPLEYVQVALFFVGMAILVARHLHVRAERRALALCDLGAPPASQAGSVPDAVLRNAHARLPHTLRHTQIARRLAEVAGHIRHRPSGKGLEDHIKYLDEQAADRIADGYSLLQNINWAVPIFGFLGTVMGITEAIASITPEQLDKSLTTVVGGLAIAFDTTAIALSCSVVLVFTYHFVKRSEEQVASEVAEISQCHLLPLFPENPHAGNPLAEAEIKAAQKFLDRTETLIETQTTLWQDSVEELRRRWNGTLEAQQQQLSAALHSGTDKTLQGHAAQLDEFRQEFVRAYREAMRDLGRQLDQSAQARRDQDAALFAGLDDFSARLSTAIQSAQAASDERAAKLLSEVTSTIGGWQGQLQRTTRVVESQLEAINRQGELLAQLGEREQELETLQRRLIDNIVALRAAETFEQTMHSLNAAVHLLTAHTRTRVAA
jgi:biopolymer transport protein ExbB/TolQ